MSRPNTSGYLGLVVMKANNQSSGERNPASLLNAKGARAAFLGNRVRVAWYIRRRRITYGL